MNNLLFYIFIQVMTMVLYVRNCKHTSIYRFRKKTTKNYTDSWVLYRTKISTFSGCISHNHYTDKWSITTTLNHLVWIEVSLGKMCILHIYKVLIIYRNKPLDLHIYIWCWQEKKNGCRTISWIIVSIDFQCCFPGNQIVSSSLNLGQKLHCLGNCWTNL